MLPSLIITSCIWKLHVDYLLLADFVKWATDMQPSIQFHVIHSMFLVVTLGLAGRTAASIRVDVRSDKGSYTSTLPLEPWDALCPLPYTLQDVKQNRGRLGGFHEVNGGVIWSSAAGGAGAIVTTVRKLLNVYPVNVRGGGEELVFAGSVRKAVSGGGMALAEEVVILGLSLPNDG